MPTDSDSKLHIRRMTADDIPMVMRLKSQAGWNQTRQDLERFLFLEPAGCLVGVLDGVPLATASAFVFQDVGWIAMILVADEARGQGLGTAITQHAMHYLDSQGVRCIRLDATPLGRPIYEKLGFVLQYELARFTGIANSHQTNPSVEPLLPEDFEHVLQLDRHVTGTERGRLLRRLHEESPTAFQVMREKGAVTGYLTSRVGSNGRQIGPGLALNRSTGRALFDSVTALYSDEPLIVDIPYENHAAIEWATEHGLQLQRNLTRMCRGPAIVDRQDAIWASSGPEKG